MPRDPRRVQVVTSAMIEEARRAGRAPRTSPLPAAAVAELDRVRHHLSPAARAEFDRARGVARTERESAARFLQAVAREGWALGQLRAIAAKARAEHRDYLTATEDAQVSTLAQMLDGAREVQAAIVASLAEQIEDQGAPRS
jgi:hypothetical protein